MTPEQIALVADARNCAAQPDTMLQLWRSKLTSCADLIESQAAELAEMRSKQTYRYIGKDGKMILARDLEDQRDALSAELATLREERDALPRLTQGMIEAACIAHYGKKRVGLCGNADGVSMTVDGIDHSFTTAFRRMWSGVRAHIRSQKGGA